MKRWLFRLLMLPPALHWNHNDYYHPVLLRAVPPSARCALDVGCGTGQFARLLAQRVPEVDAIDRSAEALALARQRSQEFGNIRYVHSDFFGFEIEPPGYDFISLIAVIHHMDFEAAARRLRQALAPDGVLAILGIARDGSLRDYARSAIAFPLNALIGAAFAMRRLAGAEIRIPTGGGKIEVPVCDPTMTLAEIEAVARQHLPGAVFRRHFFWRYSLVYSQDARS